MAEEPLSPAQKANIAIRIGDLQRQITQRESTIQAITGPLSIARGRRREELEAQMDIAQQQRSALQFEANTLRAQIGAPLVIPGSEQGYTSPTIPTTPVKQGPSAPRQIVIVAGVLFVVLFIWPRMNRSGTASPSLSGASVNAPFATVAPARERPCIDQASSFVQRLGPQLKRWDEANSLAKASARIALAPQITTLRLVRDDVIANNAPTCANAVKNAAVSYMDTTINGYLAFMGQQDETIVNRHFSDAEDLLARFSTEMDQLQK